MAAKVSALSGVMLRSPRYNVLVLPQVLQTLSALCGPASQPQHLVRARRLSCPAHVLAI
jgi:hypothetical protein